MEGWDYVPASVMYGTVVGGFMFGFVQFVAKAFMRSGETRPPNIAGTPSSLITTRGADWIKAVWHSAARNACLITLKFDLSDEQRRRLVVSERHYVLLSTQAQRRPFFN